MIFFYMAVSPIGIVLLIPILYIKMILNALYMGFATTREHYKGERVVNMFISIFLGPVIIVISLLVDVITLPGVLMRDGETLENKYQASK
jgi:hypothetical protein